MNSEVFNRISKEQMKSCFQVLDSKSHEYSTEYDRLHNFKLAAELQECNPKKALAGMMAKHVISIYDMCMSEYIYSTELWDEKITDTINYLILLKALQVEERERIAAESAYSSDDVRGDHAEN